MKIPLRKTSRTELSIRLANPEWRSDPDRPSGKVPLIHWLDMQSNPRRDVCSRELFKVYAGLNEIGERPDGLDRLRDHQFVLHFDASDKVIGLDVIPIRQYGGKMVPTHQVGVKTLTLRYDEGGSGVVRVLTRPFNTKPEVVRAIIEGLDSRAGKSISVGLQPVENNAAKVVSVRDGIIEIKLSARASRDSVHDLSWVD